MAMTGVVKDELSRVHVIKPCCRKAEVSTLLRFAGGLHLSEGRVVIEAELDTGAAARRLRASISEVFGHPAEFGVLAPKLQAAHRNPELDAAILIVGQELLAQRKKICTAA